MVVPAGLSTVSSSTAAIAVCDKLMAAKADMTAVCILLGFRLVDDLDEAISETAT